MFSQTTEYALRGVSKPIGISEYELTRALPPSLQSALPTVEQIEAELADTATGNDAAKPAKKRKAAKRVKPNAKKPSKKGRRT